jgi:hypothetical protein
VVANSSESACRIRLQAQKPCILIGICGSQLLKGKVEVDSKDRSRVNESPHLARLGRVSTVKRTRHTAEQIIRKLKAAKQMIARA